MTLLLRSVGAAGFGLAGDRFGRKWPMVINMIVLGILQIATIYSRTFQEFLAVRSLFGLFMGGVYGNAIAMALEHCPVNARGLMSGILQQGYAFGYVLAACANLGVGGSTESWKVVAHPTVLLLHEQNLTSHNRQYSGQRPAFPSPLVSLGFVSQRASNSLKRKRMGINTSQLVLSGGRRRSCLSRNGSFVFIVSYS